MITRGPSRRLLRTVLFTDIVGSTDLAAEMGDRRWRRTVAAHNTAIRGELKRHRGREVDTAGDGFFAIFENPTDAVRCAAAAVATVHTLGLKIRAAVHTGEVEPAGDKYGGIAVHIGARLLAMAAPREVLVSSTVRDLVAGSGHEFEDRGTHQLKGVPGEWHVWALVMPRFEEGVALVGVDDDELRAVATRRQRLVVAGLLSVIALLAVGLAGGFLLVSGPALPARGPNTIQAFEPTSIEPVRGVRVDRGPAGVAYGDGIAWTANTDAGTVSRVEWANGNLTAIGQAGRRPSDIALTQGRVWIIDRYSNQITALNSRDGSLLDTIPLHASAITGSGSELWIADDLAERIVRLDPASGAELMAVDLPAPAGPSDLALAGGSVWVAAPRSGKLYRVDATSGAVADAGIGLDGVRVVEALAHDVWLASPAQDGLARLDATSGRVDVRVDVCDEPVSLAPTPTGVWVACARERALWRLDRTGSIVARIGLDAVPAAVVADGERALVTLRAD
jgi:class 3 adenylate cyclase